MALFESMVCEQEVNVESRAILISLPELEIRISSGVTLSVICPRVYKQEILMLFMRRMAEAESRSGFRNMPGTNRSRNGGRKKQSGRSII